MMTAVAVLMGLTAQARERQCFDKDWRFLLGDSVIMAKADFDDSSWRQLDVPHDWAIEGDPTTGPSRVTSLSAIPVERVEEPCPGASGGIVRPSHWVTARHR